MVSCTIGILGVVPAVGCHAGRRAGDSMLLDGFSHAGSQKAKPDQLAEDGGAAITEQCAKQSYETARPGLIVSETGLHEDVFALRNRVSYGEIAYGLDEALRLESLLRSEANGSEHSSEQADCIRRFAEHLENLTDPMVEADVRLKELDASAFKSSAKEAEEQAEKYLRDTPAAPKAQP
jgi:hypothetical protein